MSDNQSLAILQIEPEYGLFVLRAYPTPVNFSATEITYVLGDYPIGGA